ncbi:hypothetical protein [Paenibacillus sp. B1-33]|uniref:hypothetical protein n=1 Tax=unclassified Paenibacillus TaxID=185978 RepID=UPI003D28A1ED
MEISKSSFIALYKTHYESSGFLIIEICYNEIFLLFLIMGDVMAFPIGGRGDKLGNNYEDRWLVRKYLDLLNNKIQSITVEAIGLDEEGVEFWTRHFDGTREAYQCKARNAMNETWTVSNLKSKGVLSKLQDQLDRSETHRFIFVSPVASISLKDLCDAARNSPDNVALFYEHLLDGKEKKGLYQSFCRALNLDYNKPNESAMAFEYLKRSYFENFPDERSDLYNLVNFTLSGDPETIVSMLAAYAINNDRLGIEIYADELYAYLQDRDIYPRNLAYDNRIVPVLDILKNQFHDSIEPVLIRGGLLAREETQECIEKLEQSGLLIIYGDAGSGKSGVLFELTQIYQQNNIQYLPLRVDRQIPKHTPKLFGESLGLPDSPVVTLHAIAGDRPALIIIDQLDAIRWTSLHSSDSFEVCKELINQILLLKRQNRDIRVILSCRSFDMTNDRRLNNWLSNIKNDTQHEWSSVEVKRLSEDFVENVVGDEFAKFNVSQKHLLTNIQNLFMWCELKDNGLITNFTSSIDLLSEFMRIKKQHIEDEGVSNVEIESVLKVLTEHMESRSENSFPGYLVSGLSPRVVAALNSSGILTEVDRKLSFGHQIYLDFLIAQRVIFEINDGHSVIEWLDSFDKQTLFRREQLRHVLIMLSQDNIDRFISISDLLLNSSKVRFHFKHLVLEIFSSLSNSSHSVYSFLTNLLYDEFWNPHVIHSVISGNSMYIKGLIENGYIQKELNSSNVNDIEGAIWLLQSVNQSIQDEIVQLLESFIDKGTEWYPRILNAIGWDIENDTATMFEFRLRLMDRGYYPHFIYWKKFISNPLRALKVTEIILNDNVVRQTQRTRAHRIERHDLKYISKAVKLYPVEAWEKYIPLILRSSENLEEYELGRLNRHISELSPLAVLVELTIIAANEIASSHPFTFTEKVRVLSNIDFPIIEYIIARGMAHLPNDYADIGIQWLLDDPARLRVGNSLGEPNYLWSRFIIEKLTPHCSDSIFSGLEHLVTHYHERNELDKARKVLSYRRKSEGSIYYPYWGVPQYLLISKLSTNRMSIKTRELLSVLKRRFSGRTDKDMMGISGFSGGWIGSTLEKNLERISDRSWLGIVSNEKVLYENHFSRRNSDKDDNLESSIWQFSKSLEKAARENPARFVSLALQFPKNVHSQYVSVILAAAQLTKDSYGKQGEGSELWRAAPIEDVIAFIERYQSFEDNNAAISLCRLIKERNEEDWSETILIKLAKFSMSHQDPLPNELNVHDSKWDGDLQNAKIEDIFTSGLNCVRGAAAQAIANVLWNNGRLLEFFEKAIESLVTDQHIVVRMASVYTLLPVLNLDKDLAVQWFLKAVEGDLRVVVSRYGTRFISYAIRTHFSSIAPVIRSMVESDNAEVATLGAEFITGFWVFYDFFEEELQKCLTGTIDQKKGIAKFATEHLGQSDMLEKCNVLLSRLIKSDGEQLSEELSGIFRFDIMNHTENINLIQQYLKSDAFTDSSLIVYRLKEYEGNLFDFSEVIFNLFDAFVHHKNKGKDFSYRFNHDIEEAIELLIILYEQSKDRDPHVFNKCLDTWDLLLEERIGRAIVLQQQLNR